MKNLVENYILSKSTHHSGDNKNQISINLNLTALLAMIANSAVQSSTPNLTHNAILFIGDNYW